MGPRFQHHLPDTFHMNSPFNLYLLVGCVANLNIFLVLESSASQSQSFSQKSDIVLVLDLCPNFTDEQKLQANVTCEETLSAVAASFGPKSPKRFQGQVFPITPSNGCTDVTPVSANASKICLIALISRGNCTFDTKISNAEKAGFEAGIIYASKENEGLLLMAASTQSSAEALTIPAYYVNYTSGVILASMEQNSTRSPLLTVLSLGSGQSPISPSLTNKPINIVSDSKDSTNDFGEHYFHICIYIWTCVVVSSLIALSIKWGCCGRSLTRWEVKRIPLHRFQRTDGDDCQDKCPICHEEFHEGRLIRQLPCNHRYHSYCVDRWLIKMSNRCPLCKQRVSVSLFCPWNKQQRKKDSSSHITSDLNGQAPPDDLPPIPPLSTLTPNNWYGDAIMSAPSKFILMRPGKPTRVIDLHETEKYACPSSQTAATWGSIGDLTGSSNKLPAHELEQQRLEPLQQNFSLCKEVLTYECPADSEFGASHGESLLSEETVRGRNSGRMEDSASTGTQLSSLGSSRSCSVSSEDPLMAVMEEKEEGFVEGNRMLQGSQKTSEDIQCENGLAPSMWTPVAAEPLLEATIDLSSASSSVISCSFKPHCKEISSSGVPQSSNTHLTSPFGETQACLCKNRKSVNMLCLNKEEKNIPRSGTVETWSTKSLQQNFRDGCTCFEMYTKNVNAI